MAPVLEHLAAAPQPAGQRAAVVGAQPGEERQLVRSGEHVDRVDLHEPDPVEHPPEVPPVDAARWARVVEALGVEGDAAGLAAAERVGGQGHDLGRVGSAVGIRPTFALRRTTMRVVVDYDLCESNALCMAAAPEVFEVRDDDFLYVLQDEPPEDLRGKVEEAARRCPKQAITIEG